MQQGRPGDAGLLKKVDLKDPSKLREERVEATEAAFFTATGSEPQSALGRL